jgi:L-alanine-DL-glutamate epimerase and related enzymes of enolase superfamily
MKITDLKIWPLNLQLKKPFRIALGTNYAYEGVGVKIETNSEIYGWGEASPSAKITGETQATAIDILTQMKSYFVGKNPLEIEAREYEMNHMIRGHSSAKAAIDVALYDILGKCAKLPVRTLIGGDKDQIVTSVTIGIENREETVKEAIKLVDEKVKIIKIKIGLDPLLDIERIKAVRDAIGYDPVLRLDANQGYSVKTAIKTLTALERYEIEFVEQPNYYRNLEGMAEIRRAVNIPLMADESIHDPADALAVIRTKAADMINIKLMKSGGIMNGIKIANISEAAGIPCMVGCMGETKIGIAAGLHLALALRNIRYADLDGHLGLQSDPTQGGIMIKEGIAYPSKGYGFGVSFVPP